MARLDMAMQNAGSVPTTPTIQEDLAKAVAEGDHNKTLAMKGQQIASWFRT